MTNREVLTKLENLICSGEAKELTALYSPEAVIYTDEAVKIVKGQMEIERYYTWLVDLDPCIDFTYTDSIETESLSVYNGLYVLGTMEGNSYKRFTFVISEGTIITQHISTDPEPVRVGEGLNEVNND